MNQTFATLIHVAPKLDISELQRVAEQLACLLEPALVKEFHSNYDLLNPLVTTNLMCRFLKTLITKTQNKVKWFSNCAS